MRLYIVVASLSAFLLFAIQPIVGKALLPAYGGGPAIWSTCMLFFQTLLLLGYVYAHGLNQKLRPGWQAAVHGALLALSLAALPVAPEAPAQIGGSPSWQILALLGGAVGLPYFLLAATSPLLQAWYARSHEGARPYRLFALSNFASLLGLLGFSGDDTVALAQTLGTQVIAEGVETAEQLDELIRLGCRQAQGFLFSKPMPAAAAQAFLNEVCGTPVLMPAVARASAAPRRLAFSSGLL